MIKDSNLKIVDLMVVVVVLLDLHYFSLLKNP